MHDALAPADSDQAYQHEKVRVKTFPNPQTLTRAVAQKVAHLVRERAAVGEKAVLGLPTGTSRSCCAPERRRVPGGGQRSAY